MENFIKAGAIAGIIFLLFVQVNGQYRDRKYERGPRDSTGGLIRPDTRQRVPENFKPSFKLLVRTRHTALRKQINKKLGVDEKFLFRYSSILKEENISIFKLLSDEKCFSEKKLSAGKCIFQKRLIREIGSGYSFRAKENLDSLFSDINLRGGNLESKETATQTILVDLGTENFEQLTLESAGIGFLTEFKPETDILEAQKQFVKVLSGIVIKNESGISPAQYVYSKSAAVKLNNSYAIRTLFYNSEQFKDSSFDKMYRKDNSDVIAVFKIIDIDEEGGVTIIWKELAKKDAPYLISPKDK